jgi:Ala-tRNA(Pro) deacylase
MKGDRFMPVASRLLEYLNRSFVEFDVLDHPVTYTAQAMAQATHIRAREVAKPVLIRAYDRFHMVILPADCLIDLDRLGELLGLRDPELATETEIARLFPDCELGAMPVFGNIYGVPVAIDDSLTQEDRLAFSAGCHDKSMVVETSDFMRLVEPRVIDVAIHV